jgi:hypothetical protein
MRRAQTYMSCIIVLDFPLRPQHSQFSLKHRRTVKLIKVTPTKRDLDKEGVKRLASILGGREAFVRRPVILCTSRLRSPRNRNGWCRTTLPCRSPVVQHSRDGMPAQTEAVCRLQNANQWRWHASSPLQASGCNTGIARNLKIGKWTTSSVGGRSLKGIK